MANQIKFDVGFNVNKSDLNTITSALKNIQNEVNKASVTGNLTDELKRAGTAASQLETILNQAWNSKLGQLDLSRVNNNIKSTYGSVTNLKTALEGSGQAGAAAYNKFASAVLNTNVQLKQGNALVNKMFDSIKNVFTYNISASIFNRLTGTIQEAFNYTKQLDTSLNDIRIVTDKSADSMERFARQANEAAKNMGASTLDYTKASLIYYQQGLSDEEVAARAETTIKAANVTGQTGEEVSEQLTAVWNGYKVSAQETELYVDKLAAVAATTAADLEELSVGMSKVASAANAMGVDFDDLNAQIATIVSVTRQAPESVGTALKTIYARMGDLSVEGGTDEFGVSLGKVSEQMQMMGIQILDQNNNLRDMSSIMAEVAQRWDGWTEAQKQAAAVAMAGKRQYNNLIALFDNWDMYTDALNTSVKAVGTLQDQQDIYMESTAAHLQQLKTEAQKTYDILFDQNTVNGFADALTGALGIFNNFIDAVGGGGKAFTALGAMATNVFSKQIGSQLGDLINNRQADLNNENRDQIQQEVIAANAANGDQITGKALEKQVSLMKDIKDAQTGLNKEEYDSLMTIQRTIGQREEEIQKLKSYVALLDESKYLQDNGFDSSNPAEYLESQLNISDKIVESYKKQEGQLQQMQKAHTWFMDGEKQYTDILKTIEILKDDVNLSTQEQIELERLQQTIEEDELVDENQIVRIQEIQKRVLQEQVNYNNDLRKATEGKKAAESGQLQLLEEERQAAENLAALELQRARTRQNMQSIVQGLSASLMLIQSITSAVSVLTDKTLSTEEKAKQLFSLLAFNLPMILTNIGSLKAAFAGLTAQMGLFTTAEVASNAGIKAMGTAFLGAIGPIGWIIGALGLLVTGIVAVGSAINRHRENFAADTKELIENTKAIKQEYDANKELISQFNELKQQYDEGLITKNELWDITNQLIDAYDIESARIAALTGDYEKFATAVKNARSKQEQELLKSQKESYNKSGTVVANDIAKGWFDDASIIGNTLTVGMEDYTSTIPDEEDQKINELYKENFGTDNRQISINIENASEILNFYNQLLQYQEDLKEAGLESSWAFEDVTNKIKQFESGEGLEQAFQQQQELIDTILQSSHLDEITNEEDFNKGISKLKNELLEIVPNEDEVHNAIIGYIGKINNDLANSFIIEDSVKQKFSEKTAKFLSEALSGYDDQTKAKILNLTVDWDKYDEDKEKIKKQVDDLAIYVAGNEDGVYSIPIGVQTNLNETILKGKDINKSDWEMMTSAVPNAEEILGDRESFNNKSIGERITLMEELNRKIQENAQLSIESYDAFKESTEKRKEDIAKEINVLEEELRIWENNLHFAGSQEEVDEAKKQIQEITDKIQDLTSEDHEIDISINTNLDDSIDDLLGGMVGEVITQTDQLKMAAESVGEAWTIAADDVANFAAVFPELMADVSNFDWLEDGSVKLTEIGRQMLNETLENNQQIMNSNKEVVLQALDDKIIELEADAEFQEKKIAALEQYLNTSVNDKNAEQEAISAIEQAGAEYEETLRKNGLIQEAAAGNEKIRIGDVSNQGLVQGLDSLNENINAVRENYANIFNENYHGTLPGYKGSGVSISSSYSEGTFGDYTGTDKHIKETVERAKEELEQARQQLSEDRREIAAYRGAQAKIRQDTNAANEATDRVQSGKAGKEDTSKSKSGGGSKEKDKKEKEEKQYKEEFDRYWQLKKAIDAVDKALEKLEKRQQHLYGWELIKSLKQENELLEKQKACYEQLADAQNKEAEELRGQLGTMGVMFDASGAIVNYAEATAAALAAYNQAIQQYNAGLIDETTLGIAEKSFENFKKLLERYDTLYYNEMRETQEKLEEIRDKEIENNLKAWETELQIKIDWNDLKKGWNKFLKEINEDFKSVFKDLRIDSRLNKKNAKRDIKNIDVDYQKLSDITREIDKMMAGEESDMFHSISEAQEKLKELNEQLQQHAKDLQEEYKQAWDNYLDGIDQVAEKLELIQSRYETINEELEYQKEIIELLYGEKAYRLRSTLYDAQLKANLSNIESTEKQVETWKELFEESGASLKHMDKWTADQKKYYDNWIAAQEKLNDLTIEHIRLLQEDYRNTVDSIFDDLDKQLTNGKGIERVREEWEKIKEDSDKYYDNVEKMYQIQSYANKLNKSISEQSNIKTQQKLISLRDEQVKKLREQTKLTEYDIQLANLEYELALREIALRDAQNNKTNMKLTRNEQGNWSYQYVADEEDVADKQQNVLDTMNQMYQLSSDAYEKWMETTVQMEEDMISTLRELYDKRMSGELSEEEYEKRREEVIQEYTEKFKEHYEEGEKYRRDLADESAGILLTIYEQDKDNYENMTEAEKDLVDSLKDTGIADYQELRQKAEENYNGIRDKANEVMSQTKKEWTSAAQEMANSWSPSKANSTTSIVLKAIEKMDDAREKYQKGLEDLQEAAHRNFGEDGITGDINKATEATENLEDQTEKMCRNGESYIESLRRYVEQLETAWNNVKQAIEEAIFVIEEYMQKQREANALAAESASIGASSGFNPAEAQANNHNPNTNGSGGRNSSNGNNGSSEDDKKGGGGTASLMYRASGGYTGEWAGSASGQGIPAILHEKEFVLNKQDTENFLTGINTIRDLASINGSIEKSIMRAVLNTANQLGNIKSVSSFSSGSASTETVSNTFNITAEFPNANDVSEIREAILSLPNIASQYINTNLL